ncbi:MAG: dihydrodipicolinate reductase [bacterium]
MLKIVQMGIGPLGVKVVRFALERGGIEIVGAVDLDPNKIGKDLGEICGTKRLGVKVQKTLKAALGRKKADVAILTTVSSVKLIEKQIAEVARAGLHMVSTCEELSFPLRTNPRISKRIDAVCRKHGVACIGTGVNPGFLMDYLPCVLSSVCQSVQKIIVTRIQDASKRRIPFQQKIGAGLTLAQFRAKVAEGTLRHVGLPESLDMIAHSMNWKLTRKSESLRPVVAKHTITSGYKKIARGMACGVEQIGRGYVGGREVIQLRFRAAVGEKDSHDTVEIIGTPTIHSSIAGGLNGDVATCAITVNAVRAITQAKPGLRTMLDLPVPGFFMGI